jgi:N-acetylglucosamine repressor
VRGVSQMNELKPSSDHQAMKRKNQLTILRAIRSLGPVSRVKLQQETTLSWGTITASVKDLITRGIVREIGSLNTGVGRRPVQLDMDTRDNYVVGLRLGGSYIRAIALDVKGSTVAEYQQFVDAQGTRRAILTQLLGCVSAVLDRGQIDLGRVAGIGIAAPGAIDPRAGVCLYAPHHPNWKNVKLKELCESKFGKPCFVDHVNNCSALGQMWFGPGKGIKNFLCVLLGTGISAGIMIDGAVYRGVNCAAGEFGHTCIDPAGPECACGSRGCLEVYATGPAIARMGREAVAANPRSRILTLARGRAEDITAESVFQAAMEGDGDAMRVFQDMGSYLGIGISNLINLFNPERIVLSGRVSRAARFFLPSLEKTMAQRAWPISSKEIKVSTVENAAVLGAAGNVLQEIYEGALLLKAAARDEQVEPAAGMTPVALP